MRYSVAHNPLKETTVANPTAQAVANPTAKPPVTPPPAPPAEAAPEEAAPEETAPEEAAPQVERVDMSGLVLEKTQYPDGECETRVLREPMIAPELVRATRKLQQARGY
jgi:hypothetical protein